MHTSEEPTDRTAAVRRAIDSLMQRTGRSRCIQILRTDSETLSIDDTAEAIKHIREAGGGGYLAFVSERIEGEPFLFVVKDTLVSRVMSLSDPEGNIVAFTVICDTMRPDGRRKESTLSVIEGDSIRLRLPGKRREIVQEFRKEESSRDEKAI